MGEQRNGLLCRVWLVGRVREGFRPREPLTDHHYYLNTWKGARKSWAGCSVSQLWGEGMKGQRGLVLRRRLTTLHSTSKRERVHSGAPGQDGVEVFPSSSEKRSISSTLCYSHSLIFQRRAVAISPPPASFRSSSSTLKSTLLICLLHQNRRLLTFLQNLSPSLRPCLKS